LINYYGLDLKCPTKICAKGTSTKSWVPRLWHCWEVVEPLGGRAWWKEVRSLGWECALEEDTGIPLLSLLASWIPWETALLVTGFLLWRTSMSRSKCPWSLRNCTQNKPLLLLGQCCHNDGSHRVSKSKLTGKIGWVSPTWNAGGRSVPDFKLFGILDCLHIQWDFLRMFYEHKIYLHFILPYTHGLEIILFYPIFLVCLHFFFFFLL
jgi:hypothetical protein